MPADTLVVSTELQIPDAPAFSRSDAEQLAFALVAGLVVLLYDHLLTLPKEVSLIWKAPASAPKYAFLLNRYIVPSILLAVAYGTYDRVPTDPLFCSPLCWL
jgi:hypothetical protein